MDACSRVSPGADSGKRIGRELAQSSRIPHISISLLILSCPFVCAEFIDTRLCLTHGNATVRKGLLHEFPRSAHLPSEEIASQGHKLLEYESAINLVSDFQTFEASGWPT